MGQHRDVSLQSPTPLSNICARYGRLRPGVAVGGGVALTMQRVSTEDRVGLSCPGLSANTVGGEVAERSKARPC